MFPKGTFFLMLLNLVKLKSQYTYTRKVCTYTFACTLLGHHFLAGLLKYTFLNCSYGQPQQSFRDTNQMVWLPCLGPSCFPNAWNNMQTLPWLMRPFLPTSSTSPPQPPPPSTTPPSLHNHPLPPQASATPVFFQSLKWSKLIHA